nr:MAG TPA: tail fiber protein [Caudoviricetes sp.]
MALKRNETYPGRFSNPTDDHPQGAFKNRSAPGAQDGSYLEQQWVNDWDGFFGRLLTLAGVTPNGNVDTASTSQYYDALKSLFLQRANPFADIKSDGSVQTALENLDLGGIASETDIQAGTPRKLIDADGLRKYLPPQVMQASGFMRIPDIPGGTIIQWGQESRVLNEGVASVVLPTPFPNTGRFAIAIPLNTAGDYNCDLFAQLQSATNTQINFYFSLSTSVVPANGFQWLALGY